MDPEAQNTKKFKFIFLGDQSVGKSSILNRYANDTFDDNYVATVGLDFKSKNEIIGGENVRLQLYDTAGQEKFKSLIPMYIRDANILIMVYDISNKASFEHIDSWYNETKELKRGDAIFVLLGNKIDLEEKRQVTKEEGKKKAEENNFIFAEVSAKTGDNIREVFSEQIFNRMNEVFKIAGGEGEEGAPEGQNKEDADAQQARVALGETEKKKKGCCK